MRMCLVVCRCPAAAEQRLPSYISHATKLSLAPIVSIVTNLENPVSQCRAVLVLEKNMTVAIIKA